MQTFGKQVCYSLVCFLHEVVNNQKSRLAAIEVVHVRQPMIKDDSRITAKQLLVLSITVDYLARWWIYHLHYNVYESKHEPSLATRRLACNDSRKRMSKRQHLA